jgi:Secretion system C-terminal sorting domain
MKKVCLLLCLYTSLITMAVAQSFIATPNDSVITNILPSRVAQDYMHFVNTTNQTISLGWQVTTQTFPSQWFAQLCGDPVCRNLPYSGASYSSNIGPGDTTFLKLTTDPVGIPGALLVVVHVWDSIDPSNSMDVTYIVNASTSTAAASGSLKSKMSISPIPASDAIHLQAHSGQLEKGTARLYDLKGALLLTQAIGNVSASSIDVRDIEPGIYLLRYAAKSGTLTEKVVITR